MAGLWVGDPVSYRLLLPQKLSPRGLLLGLPTMMMTAARRPGKQAAAGGRRRRESGEGGNRVLLRQLGADQSPPIRGWGREGQAHARVGGKGRRRSESGREEEKLRRGKRGFVQWLINVQCYLMWGVVVLKKKISQHKPVHAYSEVSPTEFNEAYSQERMFRLCHLRLGSTGIYNPVELNGID